MKNANVGSFATAKLQVIIAIAMITVIGFSFAACEVPKEKGGEDAQFVVFYLDNNYDPSDTDMGTTAYVYVDESLPHSIIMTSGNDGFVWIVASDGNTSNGARVYFKNGAVFPEHFIIAENGVTVAGATLSYNEQAGKFTAVFYQDGESETLNNITLNKNTLYAGQDVRTRNAANALLVLQTIDGQIPRNTRAASVGFWDRQIYRFFKTFMSDSEFFRNLAERLFEDKKFELEENGTDTTNGRLGLIREMDKSAIKKLKKEKDQVEGIAAIIDDAGNGGSAGTAAKNFTAQGCRSYQGSGYLNGIYGDIRLRWDIAERGYYEYRIYRAASETGNFEYVTYTCATPNDREQITFDNTVHSLSTYYYKVYEYKINKFEVYPDVGQASYVDQEGKHVGTASAKLLPFLFATGAVVSVSDGTRMTISDNSQSAQLTDTGTYYYDGDSKLANGDKCSWFYAPPVFGRIERDDWRYYKVTISGNSITILETDVDY